jgi:hypothetical protein
MQAGLLAEQIVSRDLSRDSSADEAVHEELFDHLHFHLGILDLIKCVFKFGVKQKWFCPGTAHNIRSEMN